MEGLPDEGGSRASEESSGGAACGDGCRRLGWSFEGSREVEGRRVKGFLVHVNLMEGVFVIFFSSCFCFFYVQ